MAPLRRVGGGGSVGISSSSSIGSIGSIDISIRRRLERLKKEEEEDAEVDAAWWEAPKNQEKQDAAAAADAGWGKQGGWGVEERLGQLGGRGGTLRPSVRRALRRGPRQ